MNKPTFTPGQPAPLTLEQFRAIAHRTATTYRHRSDPERSSYAFVDGTSLDDFWRKVCEAIAPPPAWHDAPEVAASTRERPWSMPPTPTATCRCIPR